MDQRQKITTVKQLHAELSKERYDVSKAPVYVEHADGQVCGIAAIVYESGNNPDDPPTIWIKCQESAAGEQF